MRRIALVALAAWLAVGGLSRGYAAPAALTAQQIAEKNVAARGGLEAWRKIQTMAWVGHMESQNAPMPNMPFMLQQKRPNKTRFEMNAMSQRTLRVFDGAQGWKTKANPNGNLDLQAYTIQELKFAREEQTIDGPLIDYAAKGNSVALEGVEDIEGHQAYRISVRLASGEQQKVWIDAHTFLDLRYDRISFSAAGKPGIVSVFYRNYQTVEGLQMPFTLEIGVGSGKPSDKMVIEKIALNPPLDDHVFAKPGGSGRVPVSRAQRPSAAAAPATPESEQK